MRCRPQHTNPFPGRVRLREALPKSRGHIAVIGAGLAGAAVCARFAAHGWQVTLIDAHGAPAGGASGNHAASFHPLIARDDNRMVRLIRAGIDTSLAHWCELAQAGFPFAWSPCGALQLSRGGGKQDVAAVLDALARQGCAPQPRDARVVTQAEASSLAGIAVRSGGVWFGQGGWVQPASLIAAQLAGCGARLTTCFGVWVARAVCSSALPVPRWTLLDADDRPIAQAPVVVLACGAEGLLPRLFGQQEWPVEAVAGQVSVVCADGAGADGGGAADAGTAWPAPRLPVHGAGYVLPCIDGKIVIGATYDRHGTQTVEAGHRHNFSQAARLFAAPLPLPLPSGRLSARVSLRAVARDRLPVMGQLVDEAALDRQAILRAGARLAHLPRLPGVYAATAYGSRGLTWAALGAQLLLAQVEGTPIELADELVRAVDPGRFALRAVRHFS